MDHQSRIVVLSALGLATVIICAYAFSRRDTKSAEAAKPNEEPTSESASSASTKTKDIEDVGPTSATPSSTKSPIPTTKGTDDDSGAAAATGSPVESKVAPGVSRAKTGGDEVEGVPVVDEVTGTGAEKAGGDRGQADEESMEALVERFNSASSMARKYFSGERYDLAAEQYGVALALCDKLPAHEAKRTALHNNRGAAFEKDKKYALALSECAMCLAREPDHKLARVRKSRVLEALGKPEDALAEVCAHLLLERDRVAAQAQLNPMQPITPPAPPQNLEGLLQKIATKRAEEVLAKREEEAGKGAEEAGGKAGPSKPQPLTKAAVTELLGSFGSFRQLERRYKGMNEAVLTRELQTLPEGREGEEEGNGESSSPPSKNASVERVCSLRDRAMVRLVKRNYDGSREDIDEAVEVLSKLHAESGTEESGVPSDVEAAVWEWKGTFLQVLSDADGAMKAYARAEAVMAADGKPCPTDVLIKMAWVHMDKEGTKEARALFARGIEEDPDYGTLYAHRSRLDVEGDGTKEVVKFLEKALSLNKKDAFSWEQLARTYVQMENIDKAMATVEEGIKNVPKSDAILLLKAELKYSLAVRAGDASSGAEIVELFEEAIRADPSNPMLYINKAQCLLQMMGDVPGSMDVLEKAVAADPTCVAALVQLANLKIMVAKSMEDAEAATVPLDKAVALCTTKQELIDTLSVLVATEGRIQGAVLLGRTTLG